MVRRNVAPEADDGTGAPEWMVTFSDCMTLLLTFFVLLLSFSAFDAKVFWKLKTILGGGWPSVTVPIQRDKDSFLPMEQIQHTPELDKGSEKPTLSSGLEDQVKEETEPVDFRNQKVFLISSADIFLGKGSVISPQGRSILSGMGSFFTEVPNRLVISEVGTKGSNAGWDFGLARAWSVLEYLAGTAGVDRKRLSISASSVAQESFRSDESNVAKAERLLEIVLLERSICN